MRFSTLEERRKGAAVDNHESVPLRIRHRGTGPVSLDLDVLRSRFPALSMGDGDLPRIFLDNPGGTQVPDTVVERMTECLVERNANLGGAFRTSQAAEAVVAEAREAMADFLNAPSASEIVFGQNMTSLTLHLSRSIGRHFEAGDEIVLSRMDHDGNVYPWLAMARDFGLEVRWLPFDTETFEFDLEDLAKRLTSRTRLVCLGAASNLLGTINDVKGAARMAHEVGAWLYVDAVQAAPHTIMDVQDIDCDFLVCSAYKFYGPHQGVLWGRREVLERLDPYRVRPAPPELPDCFESGTQSHEGMAGTAAAVDYFAWIGETMARRQHAAHCAFDGRRRNLRAALDLIFASEQAQCRHLIDGLQRIPGLRVLGISDEAGMSRRVPTVSFTVEGVAPAFLEESLARRNVFVWSGYYYALEPAAALGIVDSGGALRVGPVHYNSEAEIDAFLEALDAAVRRSNRA